ncbi:MAG TPA: FAD-dependent monooxygenase [Pseudonocardiaceae bacterium]|jgi:4,5-epoxidase|nr:FAD-dependent monooxygenase [Pseudonocardiaceae bacterium]
MTVLVVGAGPTGLVAACCLRLHGANVRIVDRASGPATTSRALGLQPRGVEVLGRVGALGDLPERALDLADLTFYANGRMLGRVRVTAVQGASRPLVIGQTEIEAALRARLAELDGTVEWGAEVRTLAEGPDGVTATLADGSTIQADWVLGCDGSHSVVREQAGIEFPGVPVAERFLLADVAADLPRPHTGSATWLHADGMFVAIPLPDPGPAPIWRFMADVPLAESDEPTEDTIVAHLRHAAAIRAGLTEPGIKQVRWTSAFRINRRLASDYRRGRLLIAGDAAHVHSPFGGQGMNTGIGDAENVAWKLAMVVGGRADESLLDSYVAERRPVASDVLDSTTLTTRMLLSGQPVVRAIRDRIVLPLLATDRAQARVVAKASQLGVSYRRGPLGGRGGIGDRVPPPHNGPHNGRWTLTVPAAGAAECVAIARARLGEGLVVLVGDGPQARLVRPDAHLAWRGSTEGTKLSRWLSRALGPGAPRSAETTRVRR